MGEMITKPDANPIVFALGNLFIAGCLGYFLMGQKSKAITALVYVVIAMVVGSITFGLLSILVPILVIVFTLDAYKLGQKLQSGESIGEKENAIDFLNKLPGFK
jgi:predicted branched-subunit amino acid permease